MSDSVDEVIEKCETAQQSIAGCVSEECRYWATRAAENGWVLAAPILVAEIRRLRAELAAIRTCPFHGPASGHEVTPCCMNAAIREALKKTIARVDAAIAKTEKT